MSLLFISSWLLLSLTVTTKGLEIEDSYCLGGQGIAGRFGSRCTVSTWLAYTGCLKKSGKSWGGGLFGWFWGFGVFLLLRSKTPVSLKRTVCETNLRYTQQHCGDAAGGSESWQKKSCVCAGFVLADLWHVYVWLWCFSLLWEPSCNGIPQGWIGYFYFFNSCLVRRLYQERDDLYTQLPLKFSYWNAWYTSTKKS